ncbi:hypothetical protein H206_05502 [Candidatus Electrothrix aarhusensis]|uniref:Uncharacterized protein n=1 Tax=Candidatus Electrothrix aarhusensis TaxID=1859131 RepID=A0A444J483_9BACT|nr:hypothetical protein H206_05502 [Candidatus Electrothrix aarhusensis]
MLGHFDRIQHPIHNPYCCVKPKASCADLPAISRKLAYFLPTQFDQSRSFFKKKSKFHIIFDELIPILLLQLQ